MEEAQKMKAFEEKMITNGPIAITEHIMIAPGPLRLKVIDHKKGYWAEAPLRRSSILDIIAALDIKKDTANP